MGIVPGVIRRCRQAAFRLRLGSDGAEKAIQAVSGVISSKGRELFEQSGVPGMGVYVRFASGPEAAFHFGQANPAASRPLDAQTCFQVLSMSKPLTALCVQVLASRGAISLDAPFNDQIRSWKLSSADPAAPGMDPDRITVRQILSHGAGLSVPRHPWTTHDDVHTGLRTLAYPGFEVRVERPAGSDIAYSGGGYVILQALIEEITGRPYGEVARELVLEPLGMTASDTDLTDGVLERLAARHDKLNEPIPPGRTIAPGSSGLVCTARDLTTLWLAAVPPRQGDPPRGNIISPEQTLDMTTPQIVTPDGRMCGLAFFLWKRRTDTEFFHSGYSYGWWGHAEGLLRRRVVFVILTNGDRGAACVKPLATLIRQCLYDRAL